MKRASFVLVTGAAFAVPHPAGAADSLTFADAVARLFTAKAYDASWFSPSAGFPPPATMQSVVAGLIATLGAYVSIAPNGSRYTLTFAHGTLQVEGAIAAGAFTTLLFSRMQCKAAADKINAIFTTDPIPAAWFSARFLQVISIDKLRSAIAAIKAQNGAFTGATPAKDGSYDVAFAKTHIFAIIDVDADGVVQDLDLLAPSA